MIGQLADIRRHLNSAATKTAPAWHFVSDRQHWVVRDATDQGFPLKREWRVKFGARPLRLDSPTRSWRAESAPTVDLEIASTGQTTTARILWKRLDDPQFDVRTSLPFELKPDGRCHTYHLDLASSPEYRGLMIGLAIEPVSVPRPDEETAIMSIVMSAVKGR